MEVAVVEEVAEEEAVVEKPHARFVRGEGGALTGSGRPEDDADAEAVGSIG